MKIAIAIATLCLAVSSNQWAQVTKKWKEVSKSSKPSESSKHELTCYGLQFQKGYECACPAPLKKGPLKGDWNCYCGTQDLDPEVVDVVALEDPTAEKGYTCQCFVDREGRKTVWDEKIKECVPIEESTVSKSSKS